MEGLPRFLFKEFFGVLGKGGVKKGWGFVGEILGKVGISSIIYIFIFQ